MALSDENRPLHRRRRQPIELPPEEPPRVIVAADNDAPDWVVSAEKISGAASRRTQRKTEPEKTDKTQKQAERPRGEMEAHAALKMQRTDAAKEWPEKPRMMGAAASRASASAPRSAALGANKTGNTAQKKVASQRVGTKVVGKRPAPKTAPKKKMTKKGRERRNRQIRNTVITLLSLAVCITLLVVGVRGGSRLLDIKRTLDQGAGVFYPNIFVNDIPLEGRTLEEAASIVTQQVESLIAQFKITLRTQDGRSWDITGADLQMKYDVANQLDQLWAIGHTGSSATKYEQVKALEEEAAMRYTTLTYDLSRVNQILTQIKTEVDEPAVSATRVADETKWPPFSYTDDVPGQTLDITGLNERICAMVDKLESGVVDLTPTPVEAVVTRAALEGQIVRLSTFETAIGATSHEGRFTNIQVSTEKFNHLIIKSGESVSFNKVAGRRTANNGYVEAPEIAYGEYVMGYGGGVCQVSSTLYNVVVNAGLQVVSRTQHSLASNYVAKGLDATVADDRLDFVFKNNTNADIYIETQYYKKKGYYYCQFTIYGRPDPNGYSYRLESEVRETIPRPAPTYVPDTNMQYVIYDDETYQSSKGEDGYIVDVYLVTLDSNGLQISRELQYTDTYKTRTPTYYVGVTPRNTPEPTAAAVD